MRWLAKAAIQRGLSALPNPDSANLVFQRRVTRNLPRSPASFRQHAEEGIAHVQRYERLVSARLSEARAYEFGAGWDLVGPLSMYCAGIERQTLVDIRPNVRFDLVDHSIEQLHEHAPELERTLGRPLRLPTRQPTTSIVDLRDRFGIDYLAPRDARETGFAPRSFELISSTFTLEHIPREDIAAILRECRRLLTGDGLISCAIDPKDHYSYFDPKITEDNFLRYGPRIWSILNPPIHYQNRLRAPDYRELWRDAELELLEYVEGDVDEQRRRALATMHIAAEFDDYEPEDLLGRDLLMVGRPMGDATSPAGDGAPPAQGEAAGA